MFATFRSTSDDRCGDVICVSSTNLPPQPGQPQNHSACDSCRSKKLKCSGQRFGCDRCQDRNLACIYSSSHQSRKRKFKMASPLEMAESVSVEKSPAVILLDNAAARYPTPSSLSRSADSEKNLEPRSSNANHDDNLQQDPEENRLSRAASTISDIDPELILQDQYASTFPQLNLSFFDSDLDFHEASPLIPTLEDIINSSGDSQNQESLRSAGYGECQESAPQISDILIGRTRSKPQSLNVFNHQRITGLSRNKLPDSHKITSQLQYHSGCSPMSSPRSSPESRSSIRITAIRPTPCQSECMSETLALLEDIQRYNNFKEKSGLCFAEQHLYLLKKAIFQWYLVLEQCQICTSVSSLMTLWALLAEKIIHGLENIASSWSGTEGIPCTSSSSSCPCLPSLKRNLGFDSGHDRTRKRNKNLLESRAFQVGEYHVEGYEERYNLFGFLISLQVSQAFRLLKVLILRANSADWETHLATLRSVEWRLGKLERQLRESIFEALGTTR